MTKAGLAAGIGLTVSLVNLYFILSTFEPTHRPYIGVSEAWIEPQGQSQLGLVWVLRLKNVGNVPGRVTVKHFRAHCGNGPNQRTVFDESDVKNRYYILPQATVLLSSGLAESPQDTTVHDIFEGRLPFKIELELSYENPGFVFGSHHDYRAILEVSTGARAPSLSVVDASGN